MKNIFAKSFEQIDKLIKRDWAYIQWSKDNKTNMRKGFIGFVKVGKQNKTRRTNYLTKMTKY